MQSLLPPRRFIVLLVSALVLNGTKALAEMITLDRRLREGADTSIDDLYGEWRFRTFSEIDELAVKASLRDLADGIQGRPVSEFLNEIDAPERRDNNHVTLVTERHRLR